MHDEDSYGDLWDILKCCPDQRQDFLSFEPEIRGSPKKRRRLRDSMPIDAKMERISRDWIQKRRQDRLKEWLCVDGANERDGRRFLRNKTAYRF